MLRFGTLLARRGISLLPRGKVALYQIHTVSRIYDLHRYYRGSVGAVLVYDITKRESFDNLGRWLNELRINEAHPDSLVMLVGNKSDLDSQRTVTQEEAMSYAEKNGLMFMETSALESINVEKAFESLIYNIFDKLSGKLATMDDKKAEIMKGQAIQISAPLDSNSKNNHSNCAC